MFKPIPSLGTRLCCMILFAHTLVVKTLIAKMLPKFAVEKKSKVTLADTIGIADW